MRPPRPRRAWLAPSTIVLATVLVTAAYSRPSTEATFPGDNGKIAWVREPGSVGEIYVMSPDGSGKVNLTQTATREYDPVWRASGSTLLFTRDRGPSSPSIWQKDALPGASEQQLAPLGAAAPISAPAWSPTARSPSRPR